MMLRKDLEIKEGVWIEEHWFQDAGLGPRLLVTVKPGEIRINKAEQDDDRKGSVKGWALFRTLGDEAQSGKLKNAAANHDRYLYGKSE